MKKSILLVLFSFILFQSCKDDEDTVTLKSDLENYIKTYSSYEKTFLIACAAGNNTSFMGSSETPISIFYYKVDGFSNVELFQSLSTNPKDYNAYKKLSLTNESLFNGRMGRFLSPPDTSSKWVIVTYTSNNNKIHISDPIQIKAATSPTVDINSTLEVTPNGLTPSFNWQNDNVDGNVIYFSLISDTKNNFISGTYTKIKNWKFYDLTNVTLNVTPTTNPALMANEKYDYTHMGVDSENWVRSFGSKPFSTN